jgi:hypothetical protein
MNKGLHTLETGYLIHSGEWESFDPEVVGFSVITSKVFKYKVIGSTMYWLVHIRGTSNSTVLTFTLPPSFVSDRDQNIVAAGINNGGNINQARISTQPSSGSKIATCSRDQSGNAWTSSGNKAIIYFGHYRIQR